MDTRKATSAKLHLQRHDNNIRDSNTAVSYQVEEETGTLIEICVSPNKNHVTAKAVSPQHGVFSNVQNSELMSDRSGVHEPKQQQHTPAPYVYPPLNVIDTPYIILGNELKHTKVKARLPDRPLSDTSVDKRKYRSPEMDFVRGRQRSEGTSSRDHKSSVGSGDFKTSRHSRAAKAKDIIDSSKSHKKTSTKSFGSDSNIFNGKSAKKVKPKNITTQIKDKLDTIYKDSNQRHRRSPLSDPGDGELRGQGPTDRHVLSTLLVTVPGTADGDISKVSPEKTDHGRAQRSHKRHHKTHILPRYGSLDSLSKLYTTPAYPNNLASWNMGLDPTNNYGQFAYVGEDGRVYFQNWAEYYPYSDNYWMYPNLNCYSSTDIVPKRGGVDATTTSSGDTSEEEVGHRTKGNIKTKTRMLDDTKKDKLGKNKALKRSLRETVPLYKYKPPRSRSHQPNVRRYPSAESKGDNRRPVKEKSSNYTDDLKAREKKNDVNSDNSSSIDTSGQQSRQKDTSSDCQTDLPERTHKNKRIAVPPPSRTIDNNFTLSSRAGSSLIAENPFLGFPRSATPGHLDQILRNTNLNLATMRGYLDAMSTSLANISASTLGNFQRPDHQGDTLENVEQQEFFKDANLTTIGKRATGLSQSPTSGHIKSRPTKAEHNRGNGYVASDSCSVITDYLDGPADWREKKSSYSLHAGRDQTYGKATTAEIYPRSALGIDQLGPEVNSPAIGAESHKMFHGTVAHQGDKRQGQFLAPRSLSSAGSSSKQFPVIISLKSHMKDTAIQTDFDNITSSHVAPVSPTIYPDGNFHSLDSCRGLKSHRLTSRDSRTQTVRVPSPEPLTNPKRMTERCANNDLYSEPYQAGTTGVSDSISNISHELRHGPEMSQRDHPNFLSLPRSGSVSGVTGSDIRQSQRYNPAPDRFGNTATLSGPTLETSQAQAHYSLDPKVDYDTEPADVYSPSKAYIQIDKPATVFAYRQAPLSPTSGQYPPLNSSFGGCISPTTPLNNYFVKSFSLPRERTRTAPRSQDINNLLPRTHSAKSERKAKSLSLLFKSSNNGLSVPFHSPTHTSNTRSPQESRVYSHKPHSHWSVSPEELSATHALTDSAVQEVPFQIYKGSPRLLKSLKKFKAHSFPARTASENRRSHVSGKNKHTSKSKHSLRPDCSIGSKGPNAGPVVYKDSPNNEKNKSQHGHFNGHIKLVTETSATVDSPKSAGQRLAEIAIHGRHKTTPVPPRDCDGRDDVSEYMYTSKGWAHVPAMPSVATVMMCTRAEDNSSRHFQQGDNYALSKDKSWDNALDKLIKDFSPEYKLVSDFSNMSLPFTTHMLGVLPKMNKVIINKSSRNTVSDFTMPTAHENYMDKLPLYCLLSKKRILYPKAGEFIFEESTASFNTTVSLHNSGLGPRDAGWMAEVSAANKYLHTCIGTRDSALNSCCLCVADVKARVEDEPQLEHVSDPEPFTIYVVRVIVNVIRNRHLGAPGKSKLAPSPTVNVAVCKCYSLQLLARCTCVGFVP